MVGISKQNKQQENRRQAPNPQLILTSNVAPSVADAFYHKELLVDTL
ncbi:hypothetical protein ACU8KH_05203 [Lachancea thermotolerans]